ncbi:MAG TPA: hypothetical protein VFK85_08790 [Anaeromyxobacteraceae bacterium]|nr:hypothetical protein [Anaeromyxobacteraceae bacterium]
MRTLDPFLGSRRARAVLIAALAFLAVAAGLLGHPATRVEARRWLFDENSPVETLTFLFFIFAAFRGLALARRSRKLGLGSLTTAFYVVYSLGMFFVGMEEIAWGQSFFHWQTPAQWSAINAQHETTLHNLSGMNDKLPVLPIVFGVGGLIGIAVRRIAALRWVAAPAMLAPWFLLIVFHQGLDLAGAAWVRGSLFHKLFDRTDEIVEMYLAITAYMYLALNARRIDAESSSPAVDVESAPPHQSHSARRVG